MAPAVRGLCGPEIENYRIARSQSAKRFCRAAILLVDAGRAKTASRLSENDAKPAPRQYWKTGNWELTSHGREIGRLFVVRLPELKLEIVKRYTLASVPADQIEEADYPCVSFAARYRVA